MKPDGVGQIDEVQFGIEESDLLAMAFDLELGGFAAQQGHDDADVLSHFG